MDRKKQDLMDAVFELGKFLRIELPSDITPVYQDSLIELILQPEDVLEQARSLNPFYLELEKEMISLQRNMDQTKRQNGFNASIDFSYGLNQGANTFKDAFINPLNQQTMSVTLSIPVFNWGESRDNLKLARLNNEISELKLSVKKEVFEQSIRKKVMEFNMNREIVINTKKAKELAGQAYNIKNQQYKLGQVKLEELNQSLESLMQSKANFIDSILQYWLSYYELQKSTLRDLITNSPLTANFEKLIDII